MNDDELFDGPQDMSEAADALTAALAAASPHRPPPELRERVLRNAVRGRRLAPILRYAAVAAIMATVTGIVTWNVAAAQLATSRHANADVAQLEATNEVVFDVIACKGGHVAVLRASQQGSVSYGKLYTCPASDDVVFMSGKLSAPPSGRAYELWLTRDGVRRLQGALQVWPSLTGSGYYFGSITFKAGQKDPTYDAAQLTLQPPGGAAPDNTVLRWNATP
jgi:anti-sigma-K factor RskA